METYFGYRLWLLLFIVLLNGFFASAEVALLSVRLTRLRELASLGSVGAQAALSLRSNPQRLLSVVQVGVTLASLAAGWAGEDTMYRILLRFAGPVSNDALNIALHVASFILSFLILTYVMVLLGEVVPKSVAISRADQLSLLVAPALLVFSRLVAPFVYVLERSSVVFCRILGVQGDQRGSYSAEELKVIVDTSHASAHIPRLASDLIHHVLDIEDLTVREIMVPRHQVVSLPADAPLDQVLRTMVEFKYARVPVHEHGLEHIAGILHYKDLLRVWEETRVAQQLGRPAAPFRLRRLLHKPLVVPETKPVHQMPDEFRQAHTHVALVVDEFGSIAGLVTLEDVLEQIVGEIEDEHDVRRHEAAASGPVLELDGITPIRDLATQYGLELPAGPGFETLAGFLLYRFGSIPKAGDAVEYGERRFTVLEMDRKRIDRVRIERVAAAKPVPAGEHASRNEGAAPRA